MMSMGVEGGLPFLCKVQGSRAGKFAKIPNSSGHTLPTSVLRCPSLLTSMCLCMSEVRFSSKS